MALEVKDLQEVQKDNFMLFMAEECLFKEIKWMETEKASSPKSLRINTTDNNIISKIMLTISTWHMDKSVSIAEGRMHKILLDLWNLHKTTLESICILKVEQEHKTKLLNQDLVDNLEIIIVVEALIFKSYTVTTKKEPSEQTMGEMWLITATSIHKVSTEELTKQ